jgi:hypothetical protein
LKKEGSSVLFHRQKCFQSLLKDTNCPSPSTSQLPGQETPDVPLEQDGGGADQLILASSGLSSPPALDQYGGTSGGQETGTFFPHAGPVPPVVLNCFTGGYLSQVL